MRTPSVVQPPPFAKCANISGPADVVSNLMIGNVVIRNSERSLVRPRSAMIATGSVELKVNVPSIEFPPLNGSSFKNFAICPLPGICIVPEPKSLPAKPVKKKLTVTDCAFGLAMATPVLTDPATCAKNRPDDIGVVTGTPASETRMSFCRKPNIATPAGAELSVDWMRALPIVKLLAWPPDSTEIPPLSGIEKFRDESALATTESTAISTQQQIIPYTCFIQLG